MVFVVKNILQKVESGVTLRKAANENHVNFMTWQRYVQKKKKCLEQEVRYDLLKIMPIEPYLVCIKKTLALIFNHLFQDLLLPRYSRVQKARLRDGSLL